MSDTSGSIRAGGEDTAAESPISTCTERWADEAGCFNACGQHECLRTGVHATHRCMCGAMVIDDPDRSVAVLEFVNDYLAQRRERDGGEQ